MNGIIFDIQRFSIYDGPGIRTNVFLKGCNLNCLWCHNPESQSGRKQLMFYRDKCVGCGRCVEICGKTFTADCTACGKCAEVCSGGAREIAGRTVTADEVVREVLRDREFYRTSGGGVTLSGGEPLLQADFAAEILSQCKENGLHTAIETAADVPWSSFEKVMPYLDLVLCDIKCIDEANHIRCTEKSNKRILENAEKLKNGAVKVIFRTPVIPEYNDGEIEKISEFCKPCEHELLAYHNTACGKYAALGLEYRLSGIEPFEQSFMEKLAEENSAIYSPTGI